MQMSKQNMKRRTYNLRHIKEWLGDFPGGPVVKNPPSNAGDVGSIPGRGTKIPHATGHLSLGATTSELALLNERACCRKLQSPHALDPAHHNYRAHGLWSPPTTTRETKPTHHN